MDVVSIAFGAAFLAGGILFGMGKLHTHIGAWKNMPPEEKEKIAIAPLCRNIGEVISLSGILFLMNGLWPSFSDHYFVFSMIAWLIVAGADLYFIQKSKRYEKK